MGMIFLFGPYIVPVTQNVYQFWHECFTKQLWWTTNTFKSHYILCYNSTHHNIPLDLGCSPKWSLINMYVVSIAQIINWLPYLLMTTDHYLQVKVWVYNLFNIPLKGNSNIRSLFHSRVLKIADWFSFTDIDLLLRFINPHCSHEFLLINLILCIFYIHLCSIELDDWFWFY